MKFVNFKIEDKKLIGVLANDEDKIIALNDLLIVLVHFLLYKQVSTVPTLNETL